MREIKVVRRKSDGVEFLYNDVLMATGNFVEATIQVPDEAAKAAKPVKEEAPVVMEKTEAIDMPDSPEKATVDVEGMLNVLGDDKRALIDYAMENYGLKIAPQTSVENIRKQIMDVASEA